MSEVDGNGAAVTEIARESSSLTAISRPSLKDIVVRRVQEAIERGELHSGDAITEIGLARKFEVAQPTIREALLELEFVGFVERTGPRKTRVTVLTRRMIDDIYIVRIRLEILAAELLAKQKAPLLEDCWKHCRDMENAAKQASFRDFFRADLAFHRSLWRATGNSSLGSSLERLVPKLFAFGLIKHAQPDSAKIESTAVIHRLLLQSILLGDLAETQRAMESSMEQAWLDDVNLV